MTSDQPIAFEVRGLPVPQGSTRTWMVNGKPITTSTAKGLKPWRRLVADVAQRFAPKEPLEGPIDMEVAFGLPRPKSEPKTIRTWPDRRPDLDKLQRSVLDALTYIMFKDDGQVVHIDARKDWGVPGVQLKVRRIAEEYER